MAVVDIKVTPAGESITHAVVLKWLKPDGSAVRTGDPVCELETDKATKEEYAPANGVLAIKAQPGQKVAIGDVIGSVDPKGVATATAPVSPAAIQPAPVPPGGIASGPPTAAPVASAPGKTAAAETRMSPAARVLADTKGLDASAISPSDRGVVTKTEVLAHLEGGARQPGRSAIPVARPAGERETRVAMTTLRARIAERLLQAQQNAAILTTFNEADMSRVMELRNRYKETFQKKHGVGLGF
ncbi:MAG: biotin/lipoyl-containing protein, partial [Gemmataceae bacterium]